MSKSSNLSLPYILPAQAQKHVTHNEALETLDAIVQLSVRRRSQNEALNNSNDGERFIVMANATGSWENHESDIAAKNGQAWTFFKPNQGWLAWSQDEQALLVFDGKTWTAATQANVDLDNLNITELSKLGLNTTPDDINRFALASEASLLSHEGAGHNLKINKATDTDTASLIFQTNYSGRAEMGTTGNDDFSVKVTSDGSNWKDAMVVDGASGAVSFPNTQLPSGGSAAPSGLEAIWRTTRDLNIGWITHPGTSLTAVASINSAVFIPLRIGETGEISKLSVYCQTGSAGQSIRIALYYAAPDKLIGELAIDFGSAACDSAGMKTLDAAPKELQAGLYYAVIQASSTSLRFRGGSAPLDTGAGILSNIIYAAGIGRIIYLQMSQNWPANMTDFTLGVGQNQIQMLGAFFCPAMLVR